MSIFTLLALWQTVHRFHSEKLRAAAPGGLAIWRGGTLPAAAEAVIFTRTYARVDRRELRLRAWSLSGGKIALNGEALGALPANQVRFFRVPGGRLRDPLEFRLEAPSEDGWGAVWMAEMSGLGTDATWACAVNGAPASVHVWGAPPLSSFPALGR